MFATIHDHIRKGVQQACPSRAATPRNKVTSEVAWDLIRQRGALKRHLFHQKRQEQLSALREVFTAWRGHAPVHPAPRQFHAFVLLQLQQLNRSIKHTERLSMPLKPLARHLHLPVSRAPRPWPRCYVRSSNQAGGSNPLDWSRFSGTHMGCRKGLALSACGHLHAPTFRPIS